MPKRVLSAHECDQPSETVNKQFPSKRIRKTGDDLDISEVCQKLYDALRSYKSKDERILCENFIRLPSRRNNSDYYNVIQKPIDFIRIQQKIRTDDYQTLEHFFNDVELLLSNAKNFYRKNCDQWCDANELSKYFDREKKILHDKYPRQLQFSKSHHFHSSNQLKKKRSNRKSNEISTDRSIEKLERDELLKSNTDQNYYFDQYFTAIYKTSIDTRPISDIFLFLPSRKLYPDYYLIVSKPIDLKMIAVKIRDSQYSSLDEIEHDFLLMISNAKKYNDPKSQIYKDACALKKVIRTVKIQLESTMETSSDSTRTSRIFKYDEFLSTKIASFNYPFEPEDKEIIRNEEPTEENSDTFDSGMTSLDEEENALEKLYKTVTNCKIGAQRLIEPFMKLPDRRSHQDYYKAIKKPIAMSKIKKLIKEGKYKDLYDLVNDLKLMFDNAKRYNRADSLMFNNAERLLEVTLLKAHELGCDQITPKLREVHIPISPIFTTEEDQQTINNPSQIPEDKNSSKIVNSTNDKRHLMKKTTRVAAKNIRTLYKYMRNYRENGENLIELFVRLPPLVELPDYCKLVKSSIDLSMIEEKIDKQQYESETNLIDDFLLMFGNAKIYYDDDSKMFKNACHLERALMNKNRILIKRKEKLLASSMTPSCSSVNSQLQTKVDSSSSKIIDKTVQRLLDAIKFATDCQGRVLSTPFSTLPSKIDFPDYYDLIKNPIDLSQIESRGHSSIDELYSDLQLMFDNACLYNEPGSQIYRDALTLQLIMFKKRSQLKRDQYNVHQVPNLVLDLIWTLFIETFNYEGKAGRYLSDSFFDLPESVEHEPFELIYTFDLIKQNLNRRRYRRLDTFQDDFFKVFERARYLSAPDSQVYQDSIALQRFYIDLRDQKCCRGNLLRSPAFLYNGIRLQEELIQNPRFFKQISHCDMNDGELISMSDDSLSQATGSVDSACSPTGEIYHVGDFVYIETDDKNSEPTIICIQSFKREKQDIYLTGLQFLRPHEIFRLSTRKFFSQEVFLSQTNDYFKMKKIRGLCHVLHLKDYLKFQPTIIDLMGQSLQFNNLDKDIYVCESRYYTKNKMIKKIKCWDVPESRRVKLIPRESPINLLRIIPNGDGIFQPKNHSSISIDEQFLNESYPIEKRKDTVLQDSVIDEKCNKIRAEMKQFYEQIVINQRIYYKIGDYVYTRHTNADGLDKRSIVRIDYIWKENDSYIINGLLFLQFDDIINKDPLIVTNKVFHEREVIQCDNSYEQFSVDDITGKCSVLSLEDYCNYRLTEIPEHDVYICRTIHISDNHCLRNLSEKFKKPTLSSKVLADEIWILHQKLILQQETPGGPFKSIDDGSFMDVDEQTNSNHASTIDGDEPQSNHLNLDPANSSINSQTNNIPNSPSTPNRNNSNRKNNRRSGSSVRAPCGYLVFASESRKRLIKDNPGIPFGEMSRMIGDQWRRLTATERDKFEEKARERAREQEILQTQVTSTTPSAQPPPASTPPVITNSSLGSSSNYETQTMPVISQQRIVNGTVTINGHYQPNPNVTNVHQINGNVATISKPPTASIVTGPSRTQRLVHSEAYVRYIENLKTDSQFISDWPKQLKASMASSSNPNNGTRALPTNWFSNNSPGLYNNVYEALWSMRDKMWSDVVRIRNVLSDEW